MIDFKPYVEDKVWGSVQHIFSDVHAAVSCLTVVRGTCCSIHYHEDRVNMFNVLSGVIAVEDWGPKDRDPEKRHELTILHPGEVCLVDVNRWHRFRVILSGRIVEVYYPTDEGRTVRIDDIVRWNVGSKDDLKDLEGLL